MADQNEYSKGLILGSILGGIAGAVIAMLITPKSGRELRDSISQNSTELLNKATDYFKKAEEEKIRFIVSAIRKDSDGNESIRAKADSILAEAERVLKEVREKVSLEIEKEDV